VGQTVQQPAQIEELQLAAHSVLLLGQPLNLFTVDQIYKSTHEIHTSKVAQDHAGSNARIAVDEIELACGVIAHVVKTDKACPVKMLDQAGVEELRFWFIHRDPVGA